MQRPTLYINIFGHRAGHLVRIQWIKDLKYTEMDICEPEKYIVLMCVITAVASCKCINDPDGPLGPFNSQRNSPPILYSKLHNRKTARR
jgi:hypothetical protein